ncbi:MAG TPA: chloride channel protein [Thermoleophilaceae bacterium]|jgi:H+/Cl- antiporter ClcA
MADAASSPADPSTGIASKRFLALLVLAGIVGVVVSFAAWGFLELVHQIQVGVFQGLPKDLGFDSTPRWWYLPVLAIAGVIVAFAITRLPGGGGHSPAHGLSMSRILPSALPGVILAGLAGIGLGLVIGPEAPLIALGGGLGLLAVQLVKKDAPDEVGAVMAAAGTFAALSLIFASPLIAAVLLIEAAGLGGRRLNLVLIPGLLAAGIGSLISIGMGSWTGLSTSAYALGPLTLPAFARPDVTDFLWTAPFAAAVALGTFVIFRLALAVEPLVTPRPFLFLPAIGLVVAGLAIAFTYATDKGASEVLFSGQDQLPGLASNAASWSLGALALLILLKGIGYALSLSGFRGGPTFPAMFLGAAAGLMASHLPGFEVTPAVAVGMGAGVVAVLRLPLSAVVLGVVLTDRSGPGSAPLVIFGVVVAYIATVALSRAQTSEPVTATSPSRAAGADGGSSSSSEPSPQSIRATSERSST